MLLALLACLLIPSWRWDRSPEPEVVSYRVEIAYRDPRWYPCTWIDEESGKEISGICPAYLSSSELAWITVDTPEQPATSETPCTSFDAGPAPGPLMPCLDCVILYNVRAVDASGNFSN